ncbi:MAG: 30S ribosomal protein S6 [Deltaproteobacteria bacterium]|nr:MAG: 30S ribosomal protein S6 [Deltaproteobacteria bacterium]TDJ19891.1 MAG: 30S ribosomal protein S6 [Deltaproteobacteria bacterium]
MREYETTFIVQPEITDEGIQAICHRIEAVLEKQGGTKLFYDDMGRRRLSYEIRNFQKGQYLTLFYLDEGKAIPEIERCLRLDDSILRYLTVLANDDVTDIEARKAEAAEIESLRAQKVVEKAEREAEDAARAAEEAATAEAAAAAAAKSEAAAKEAPDTEASAEVSQDGDNDGGASDATDVPKSDDAADDGKKED